MSVWCIELGCTNGCKGCKKKDVNDMTMNMNLNWSHESNEYMYNEAACQCSMRQSHELECSWIISRLREVRLAADYLPWMSPGRLLAPGYVMWISPYEHPLVVSGVLLKWKSTASPASNLPRRTSFTSPRTRYVQWSA